MNKFCSSSATKMRSRAVRKSVCLLHRNYFVRMCVEDDVWRNASFPSFHPSPISSAFSLKNSGDFMALCSRAVPEVGRKI